MKKTPLLLKKGLKSDLYFQQREEGSLLFAEDTGQLYYDNGVQLLEINKTSMEMYVDNKIEEIIGEAPEALDTLNELAKALGNDSNFASVITNELDGLKKNIKLLDEDIEGLDKRKVEKEDGKKLSTNDFTNANRDKLDGIPSPDTIAVKAQLVGQKTARNGEIFNDYNFNIAYENAHAEGTSTEATGKHSHAEGAATHATGHACHTEGFQTYATGDQSHAEGLQSKAYGLRSHAEGWGTTVKNTASGGHSGGIATVADNIGMTAIGINNKIDDPDALFVVGNGNFEETSPNSGLIDFNQTHTDEKRSNAFKVKKNGDTYISGNLYVNGNVPSGTISSIIAGDGLEGGIITHSGIISLSQATKDSLKKADTALQSLSGKKDKQSRVNDPTADGTATAFIDSIIQNENGEITVTKKKVNFNDYATQASLLNEINKIKSGETSVGVAKTADGLNEEYAANFALVSDLDNYVTEDQLEQDKSTIVNQAVNQAQQYTDKEINKIDISTKAEDYLTSDAGKEVIQSAVGTSIKDLLLDFCYPIGSIYMTMKLENPKNLFGGTWEQISEKFLFGASSLQEDKIGDKVTYKENEDANYKVSSNGTTNMPYGGGSETVTLTENEMPKHTHTIDLKWGYDWKDNQWGEWSAASGHYATSSQTSTEAGGGLAHNNMPPYTIVYIWQRIEDPKPNTETTE